jgi:hypothetical protein
MADTVAASWEGNNWKVEIKPESGTAISAMKLDRLLNAVRVAWRQQYVKHIHQTTINRVSGYRQVPAPVIDKGTSTVKVKHG